jgi:DNA-binding NarL/FixJ family response regulator
VSTSIILADGHAIFRDAVRALLETCEGFNVIGEASDGQQALDLAHELKPDVLVTEIALPRLSGIEVARRLSRSGSRSRVLILSSHEGRSQVQQAMRSGAVGYVTKSGSAPDLIQAIEAVRSGRGYLSPLVAQHVVDAVAQRGTSNADRSNELTSREREVLQLVAEGLSSKEIASCLGVSTRTVESHRAKVMDKLGIHKVSGLVRFAIREGLLNP